MQSTFFLLFGAAVVGHPQGHLYDPPRCAEANVPIAACMPSKIPACRGTKHAAAATPTTIRRLDYTPLPYMVNQVKLAIDLNPNVTVVDAELEIAQNEASELVLNGSPDMHLVFLSIDDAPTEQVDIDSHVDYVCLNHTDWTLRVGVEAFANTPTFKLKTRVLITPVTNTHLFGLYESEGLLLTQNEAEGFRRITYFPDRPDVLSKYNVTLVANKDDYPVLLANGDRTAYGEFFENDTERHWATFVDPWPKPAYLFALVAGNLTSVSRSYQIGRPCVEALSAFYEVPIDEAVKEPLYKYCKSFPERDLKGGPTQARLSIWGAPGVESRLTWALDSLEKAMLWDEIRYGRFYDLKEFHVVAAKSFNAGAMENKGLNIFNEALILADPSISTDAQYSRIQGVIAHEYFHNWSGDRVTVRDWFQLSLKEGFTVFRDQEFTEDITKSFVKRVEDAKFMQDVQFREDAGPLAHPARPDEYMSPENLYTATVYEKGSEIVRMYKTLMGWEKFRHATDHYFETHDGRAASLEDFLNSMEVASGEDLQHFFRWYHTAGTPVVNVVDRQFHRRNQMLELTLSQSGGPLLIPLAVGFLSKTGPHDVIETQVLRLSESKQTFYIHNISEPVIPTINRGFSAPIIVGDYLTNSELYHQAQYDSCGYIKWQAGQALMRRAVLKELTSPGANPVELMSVQEGILLSILEGGSDFALKEDMAGLAYRLRLPPVSSFEDYVTVFDPIAVFEAKQRVARRISLYLRDLLWESFNLLNAVKKSFEHHKMTTNQMGVRMLRNEILSILAAVPEDTEVGRVVYEQLNNAVHQNEAAAALNIMSNFPISELREKALRLYRRRAGDEDLLINRWLSAQASSPAADTLDKVTDLAQQSFFVNSKNPNRIRALLGSFSGNKVALNADDGAAYEFLANEVIRVDRFNPKVAARIARGFTHWAKYPSKLKHVVYRQIQRLLATPTLSTATREILHKAEKAGTVVQDEGEKEIKLPSAEL